LVVRRPGPTQRQYALLEATREFAHDRAAQSGELELARARHGALFLQFGLAAAAALDGPSAPRWTAQFELAESDIRAAIEQLRGEDRLEDAAVLELALAAYALRRYRLSQIRERLGPLGVDPRLSGLTRAEAFRRSGEAAMVADDFVAAASAFAAALEVATAAHLDEVELRVRVHQAELMRAENAPEEQILSLLDAVLEAAAAGAVEAEGEALRLRAITHWDRGELQQARTDAERARRQAQRHGRVRSLADTQNTLSGILRDLGELDSAEELLEFAGAYFRAIDDPLESAYNDYSRARIALLKGELQMAVELGEESLRRFSLISDAWGAAMSQRLLGEAALALGQTVEARRWLKSALGALEERAFTADIVGVSEALARLALSEGAAEQAVATARGALALIQPSQRSRYRASLLTTLSLAELASGRPDAALEAAGAAVDAAGESGAVLPLAQAKQALRDCQKATAAG
ncbi:MAG: hypothetical protein ACREN1_01845, partial [Candidatus Dormibacteria bacterium]